MSIFKTIGRLNTDRVHLTDSLVKTRGLTAWVFLLLVGMAECVTRLEYFQAHLTPPVMGSRHYQLGHKLALLDAEIIKNGPVDCIMVGSSMVDVGFDPESFQGGYQEITGENINCFNFGIDASSAASTSALSKILVEDYHPPLLLFGTDPRDYAVARSDPDPAVVLNTPWVAYRQGDFSLEGWLLEHSYLYRYRQHLSRLARFQFDGTLWASTKLKNEILPDGFTPLSIVSTYINDPPNPQDESFEVTYYTRLYSSYQMLHENLVSLEDIMAQNGPGTQVILVEMPVAEGLYYFFGNGRADYNQFLTQVGQLAKQNNVPFWQTESLDFIPDEGWVDYSHLNTTGAEIFSAWLGQQVGVAEEQGMIKTLQP